MNGSELVDKLHTSTRYFRSALKDAGFTLKGDDHPIVPVMLGDARLATEFADEMLERGIYVIGFSYPVVPKGEAFSWRVV
jgi:glycine C-acetyltransferase